MWVRDPHRILAYTEAVDMRKSFAGLTGAERTIVDKDPLSGHAFCFFNRPRNYLKVLFWDGNGYCVNVRAAAFANCP